MNERTAALIDGWDARPFTGGFGELASLAAASFTGIVRLDTDEGGPSTTGAFPDREEKREGTTHDDTDSDTESGARTGSERIDGDRAPWLAMVGGEVRGVFDGDIEAFGANSDSSGVSNASGTVHAAPAGAPALLCAMIERSDEERGDLYTDESLSEVDEILPTDFTGYVELIGNGLDGAYYVVYDRGEAMPIAVQDGDGEPTARTDSETLGRARERASVYEVRPVTLGSIAIPEPEPEPKPEPEPASAPEPGFGSDDSRVAHDAANAEGTAPRSELIAERDRLRADVERLEAALDAYRSGASRGAPVADADGGIDVEDRGTNLPTRRVPDGSFVGVDGSRTDDPIGTERDPEAALAGTTLLVRYDSLGAPTLARAGGDTNPEAVRANLRITPHTDFDATDTVVSGAEFGAFLQSSAEYRFVEWLLGQLFFEIRETGNQNALSALYEVIPAIDRADLKGRIDVEYVSEGETEHGTEKFDVVFRDRMNEPLVIARLDDTPEPAPVERVTDLLTAANRVGETVENLAGAFGVSGGYFEPDALETAEQVTDGGFLSRDSKKSFVKRSRRRGYHLCLVEAVGDGFHLSVPEL